jgi:hypothetical protein
MKNKQKNKLKMCVTTHEVVDERVDSAVGVAQPVRNHGDCHGRVVLWNASCVSANEDSIRLIQPDMQGLFR